MQTVKECEADAARKLFLTYGVSVEMLGFAAVSHLDLQDEVRRREQPEAVIRGTPAHDGTDAYVGCECSNCMAWRRSKANELTTIGQELQKRGLPQLGAPFGNHQPVASVAVPHINAPINITGDGTRWSQCAKCRKVFSLRFGFIEGSHLCCAGCGQNLLLKKMSNVEWEALTEQYPQRDSTEADAADKLKVPMVELPMWGNCDRRMHVQQIGRGVRKAQPISLSSPLAIQMLMHFYANRARFINAPVRFWPPAQRAIVDGFMLDGLIREIDHEDYVTTDKGALIAATLKAVMSEGLKNV